MCVCVCVSVSFAQEIYSFVVTFKHTKWAILCTGLSAGEGAQHSFFSIRHVLALHGVHSRL